MELPRKRYGLSQTFFWAPGKHAAKVGVRMAYEDLDYDADYYGAGVKRQFNTDRAFNAADPTMYPTKFTVGSGLRTENYTNTEWGFFAQDDIKLRSNVTVNLGGTTSTRTCAATTSSRACSTTRSSRASRTW